MATPGTQLFGYSLFGLDVTDRGNPSNLLNWTNASFFPHNTRETVTQGANGIDLLAANVGVVQTIPESSKSCLSLVLLGAAWGYCQLKPALKKLDYR